MCLEILLHYVAYSERKSFSWLIFSFYFVKGVKK